MKTIKRKDDDEPFVTARLGWRYHHLGIPLAAARPGMTSIPRLKISVAGFETSPYGIQWMRFEPGSGYSEPVRTLPHVAFEVDDLERALRDCAGEVITPPNSPSPGVRVAMVLHDGAPIELIEFRKASKRKKRFEVRGSKIEVKKKIKSRIKKPIRH